MMMDLSFWEPPNWQKESRISPMFWVTISCVVVVLALVGYSLHVNGQESDLTRQLAESEAAGKRLAPNYSDFTSKGKLYKDVKNVFLADLRARANSRRLASQTMQKFFKLVPDNMVLKDVALSAFSYSPDKKKKTSGPKPVIQKLRHRLTFSAVMTGMRSEKDVMDFSNLLGSERGFGDQILTPEIKPPVTEEVDGTMQTAFTIECVFKEK